MPKSATKSTTQRRAKPQVSTRQQKSNGQQQRQSNGQKQTKGQKQSAARSQSRSGDQKKQKSLDAEAQATLQRLEEKDRGLKQLLKKAHGYAVFPNVGRASLVIGGSYGRGAVYEQDEFIGYATIGQTTAGVQLGGKTFSEVLIFENEQSLERFKQGKVKFAANASAVLLKAGAEATKGPEKGVKALAYSKGGMALEISIGGQKFSFKEAGDESDDGQEDGGQAQGLGSAQRGQSQSNGRQALERNGGSPMAQAGGRGLKLAAAAAAAAIERVKPEDITLMLEAVHRTLRKFAEGSQEDDEEGFPSGEGDTDARDEGDEEDEQALAGDAEDELDDEEGDVDAEGESGPDDEDDEEYEEAAEYDEPNEEDDEYEDDPEAEYEEDEYEDEEEGAQAEADEDDEEEEAPQKRRASPKRGGRQAKGAKAASSRE